MGSGGECHLYRTIRVRMSVCVSARKHDKDVRVGAVCVRLTSTPSLVRIIVYSPYYCLSFSLVRSNHSQTAWWYQRFLLEQQRTTTISATTSQERLQAHVEQL